MTGDRYDDASDLYIRFITPLAPQAQEPLDQQAEQLDEVVRLQDHLKGQPGVSEAAKAASRRSLAVLLRI